jgi:predicted ATP-dependent endonuclease of OLD family
MAKIEALIIKNFRGIKDFHYDFDDSKLICIVGRGNSGKSTILDAISYVLSPKWNLSFYDTDFYNCDITQSIKITVILGNLTEDLIREDKFGLLLKFYNKETKALYDSPKEDSICVLELNLEIDHNLEPTWYISKGERVEEIKSSDRGKMGVFLIADNLDSQFLWKNSSPLKAILNSQKIKSIQEDTENDLFLAATRHAKTEIDDIDFPLLKGITEKISSTAESFGAHITHLKNTIDIKSIQLDEKSTALHNNNIPIRLLGKGSKKILSIAIQLQLFEENGILLIDEIEQGLEPDRAQHLVTTLKSMNSGQVFLSTHSRDVLVELSSSDIYLMKESSSSLISFDESIQGTIRKNPEAFFAKSLLICEGATEVGFCRYLNQHRIENGKGNISTKGIRIADGQGNEMETYLNKFSETHDNLCLFCDSDDDNFNPKKGAYRISGINIVDCDTGNSLENQVFKDVPWEGVKQLIDYQIIKTSKEQVEASISSKLSDPLSEDWLENDQNEIRIILGNLAKKKEWFKRIDHGEFLASVCINHRNEMSGSTIHKEIQDLEDWMDNA